jgi:hypothetical protein
MIACLPMECRSRSEPACAYDSPRYPKTPFVFALLFPFSEQFLCSLLVVSRDFELVNKPGPGKLLAERPECGGVWNAVLDTQPQNCVNDSVSTTVSISARNLSQGVIDRCASSGSPFAESAASRLSASKNPNWLILTFANHRRHATDSHSAIEEAIFSRRPYAFVPDRLASARSSRGLRRGMETYGVACQQSR